ncbi:hypothetical protein [Erysipelothrix rhusiopathiae]|uniref:hypothetical protein n=1 Tax=Erysipelothrix rhusiopathiae TaxID=1648 RepID=UPI000F43016B|nr:hypothetical protein [Erysipelothrix rhusiopathiae]AYV34048.1 hypothetical protein EEY85_01530 [Erysipelothrix rhusiopathiae]
MKKFMRIVLIGVVLSITQFKAIEALDSSVSIIGMTEGDNIEGYHDDTIVRENLDRVGYESLFSVKSLPNMFDVDMKPVILEYKRINEELPSKPGDDLQEKNNTSGQPAPKTENPDQETQRLRELDDQIEDIVAVEYKPDLDTSESEKPVVKDQTQDTLLPPTSIRLILSQIGIVFIVIGLFIRKKSIVSK